jgi:ribosome-associated translation inhibitor RaiA
MNRKPHVLESYEISPRFRQSLEERIARLERDADHDELTLAQLESEDHRQRHRRLVSVQRTEALRMRSFLERTTQREPRPLIAL